MFQEADWKTAYGKLTEDIDGKLDRLELDPLKEWLEQRLKALNDKLKKYQTQMDWSEDDAAGIRKYVDDFLLLLFWALQSIKITSLIMSQTTYM